MLGSPNYLQDIWPLLRFPTLDLGLCLQDIRTFVAMDDAALAATHPNMTDAREIWGHYPDDLPLKGLHAGDTRAALTPFLAHQV